MGSSESKNKAMEGDKLEEIAVPPHKMTHDCYEHYELKSEGKVLFKCEGCKMDGYGPRYVCSLCDMAMHKWCRFPKSTISHDYLKHSTLKFTSVSVTPQVSKRCTACWKDVLGFSYHCQDGNFDLHPSCYKLDTKICFDNMLYTLYDKLSYFCVGCENRDTNGWSYVSSCNKYHFHVHCLMEKVREFEMKHGDNSYSTTNKVEMTEVDLASVLEPKIQNEKEVTPDQLFMGYVTVDADADADNNSPKKKETEPGKNGIRERIVKFFKTLFRSLIAGVLITCEYVHKVAKTLWLKITPEWCQKIINFCRILLEISIAVYAFVKGTSKVTGEMVQKIAKRFNVTITREQGESFLVVLEILIKLVKSPMAEFM